MSWSDQQPIVFSVLSGLESPGEALARSGHVDLDSFEMGGREFSLPSGLDFDVVLTNTGEGILVTGMVRGEADTSCDRCLGPAHLDIASEVSCYYLREEPQVDDDDDEEYGLISPEGTIDISEAVQGAVLMDLPYVILCRDDCLGLCPTCGCNLNEETCDCASTSQAQPDPMNPFSVLAGLTFSQDEGGPLDQRA